ncbi:histidinol-phosphate transaminase, partial [Selenomonas sp.]|uniref:histidinol-phosphate transaminase n=1 Tax=Selenomonas sp. TaxID=2053611 RepID=UPI002A832458
NGLADMPSYDVVERPWEIKINANECNMSLPPLVEERVMNRLGTVAFNRYPNEQYDDLRDQIARNFSMQRENVLIGSGSSEIIEKLFYCFGGSPEAKIVYPQPSFSMYKIYAKAAEATGVPVDLNPEDYSLDIDKFIQTVNEEKATLAVICNPNNPTGNAFTVEEIEKIASNIDCAFLVDEAYMEFYGQTAVRLLAKYPNMIIARTFSKAYGLASCRVGYAIGSPDVMRMIGRAFMPYHMNTLSLVTADVVYQMRDEYVPRIQMVIAERKRMIEELKKVDGVTVYPSETNFVLFHLNNSEDLTKAFEAASIGVRHFGNAPRLANCLRISMGTRQENDTWLNVLKDFMGGAQ